MQNGLAPPLNLFCDLFLSIGFTAKPQPLSLITPPVKYYCPLFFKILFFPIVQPLFISPSFFIFAFSRIHFLGTFFPPPSFPLFPLPSIRLSGIPWTEAFYQVFSFDPPLSFCYFYLVYLWMSLSSHNQCEIFLFPYSLMVHLTIICLEQSLFPLCPSLFPPPPSPLSPPTKIACTWQNPPLFCL